METLAAQEAGKFDAVVEEKKQLESQLATLTRTNEAARKTAEDAALQQPFLQLLGLLAPRRVEGHHKLRAGRDADGGYVMLDDFEGLRTAISGGIGNEVTWDFAMADRGIDVIQVDHTVPGPPVSHPRFVFRQQRLVGIPELDHDVTLADLIAACPGEDDSIVCKLDIEGAEWNVLARPVAGLRRCRQIVVEFHQLHRFGSTEWRTKAMACLEQINADFQCIHVHGNNAVPIAVVGGVAFPTIVEATFVRRDCYAFEEETASFPTPLDAPNMAGRADILIGRFPGS